jgi:hypothetical protein
LLPKPKSQTGATMARLSHVRGEVATTLEFTRKVQEMVGSFLTRHYEMIPPAKVKRHEESLFKASGMHFAWIEILMSSQGPFDTVVCNG